MADVAGGVVYGTPGKIEDEWAGVWVKGGRAVAEAGQVARVTTKGGRRYLARLVEPVRTSHAGEVRTLWRSEPTEARIPHCDSCRCYDRTAEAALYGWPLEE